MSAVAQLSPVAVQKLNPKPNRFRVFRAMAGCTVYGMTFAALQFFAMRFRPNQLPRIPRKFHRGMCRGLRIDVGTIGTPAEGPVLFVANHLSWSDIPVIGSQLLASFVAKADVEHMGMLGKLADLQRTIYVERERRSRVAEQRNEITERLLSGESVILFPEGTSSEGNAVLPFKSSLFSVVDGPDMAHIRIQPVTLSYTHLNGLPLLRAQRHKIAWVGDMDFGPHAWGFLGLGRIRALIQYHPAVERSTFANRKELAKYCEETVAKGLRLANAGRVFPQCDGLTSDKSGKARV
jgi:lyso-ornithine lipid O-acyltransferase